MNFVGTSDDVDHAGELGNGAALAEGPNLGKNASPEEIASWDISIGPSGAGLAATNVRFWRKADVR